MKKELLLFALVLSGSACFARDVGAASPTVSAATESNNEGVKALSAGDYSLAIQKLEAALKLNPDYAMARMNLAIAHSNLGLQLRSNPKEALREFHKALFLNGSNEVTQKNAAGMIKALGKNPDSFDDRVQLAQDARTSGDFVGAIVEYNAALKLKDDRKIHEALGQIYTERGEGEESRRTI